MKSHRSNSVRQLLVAGSFLASSLWMIGCGEAKPPAKPVVSPPKVIATKSAPKVSHNEATKPRPAPVSPKSEKQLPPPERRTLEVLAEQAKRDAAPKLGDPQQPGGGGIDVARARIQEDKALAIGIRKIVGKHLVLFTDLPAGPAVDELPAVFDLAVPQWCEYFSIASAKVEKWRLFAYVMKEREKFESTGALTDDLPDFPHGFQKGHEIWIFEQPTDYYRRHLVLHEGTHAFMGHWLGNYGPPWYAEGVAELLGTHRWSDGKLTLRYIPRDREESASWGRVKIIRDDYAARRAKRLEDVMQYGPRDHYRVEPYGWCWGAATFFDNHPRTQAAFRELKGNVGDISIEFSLAFQRKLQDDWRNLSEEWQLFVAHLDYGMDVKQLEIIRKPAVLLPVAGGVVQVAANRGWQSTGLRLEAGQTYQLSASGRFQIGQQPKTWWCEPDGVTIRYYQNLPLGMLLGAITDDDQPLPGLTPLANPDPVGSGRAVTPGRSGTLYLRVNEFFGDLADNVGELTVRIVPK